MISERLRALRIENKLSKRDLVTMLPLNYSTYANYESGFREPNSDVLQMLAKHFNVSIDYLLGVSDSKRKADDVAILNDDEHDLFAKYRLLDLHGKELVDMVLQKEYERHNFFDNDNFAKKSTFDGKWVTHRVYQQNSCSMLGNYFVQEQDLSYELLRFATTPVSERADFCVQLEGDNMAPKICSGDIVFVKSTPRVEPDSVGIFVLDGETRCNRLRIEPRNKVLLLESLNRKFQPQKIGNPESLHTVGLVIGIAERVLS